MGCGSGIVDDVNFFVIFHDLMCNFIKVTMSGLAIAKALSAKHCTCSKKHLYHCINVAIVTVDDAIHKKFFMRLHTLLRHHCQCQLQLEEAREKTYPQSLKPSYKKLWMEKKF